MAIVDGVCDIVRLARDLKGGGFEMEVDGDGQPSKNAVTSFAGYVYWQPWGIR